MGDELFDHILKLVNDTPWPENPFVNAKSQHIFEMGMDVLNMYRGHPQILVDALSVFYQTDARPYAYAGIAAVLIGAAYSHSDIYEEAGLQEAQRWLEQAQALVPDRLEINLVEVSLYRAWRQNDNARILLDYFQQENYEHFFLSMAEMGYWGAAHNIPKCYEWYRHAMNLADRPHRKLYANNTMGGIYLTNKCYTHAIDAYKRVAKIEPEDPWLWHNMSIAHIQLKEYREAEACNKKALGLMEFGAAQNVKAALEKLKASRRY